jgi:asparagine synthase (glutamine-hydrolysing)
MVEPDATAVLDKLVWHYDEPYSDASALPTYYLSKLTRSHVTVALTGDAGDENFGGYPRYLVNVIAEYLCAIPGPLRRLASGAALQSCRLLRDNRRFAKKLRILANTLITEPRAGYARLMTNFDAKGKRGLYSDDFARGVSLSAAENLIATLYRRSDAQDLVDATLNVDLNLYLPDDLLVKVDIASMAVGLEARSPMVDHEFIEFVARLPSRFKISGLTLKAIFKKALKDLLPAEILGRRKMGFGVPLEHWFRGQLRDFLRDILLSRRAVERGYFKPAAVAALIDAHLGGSVDHQYQLWNLLMLELWHRVCVDAPMTSRYDGAVSAAAS